MPISAVRNNLPTIVDNIDKYSERVMITVNNLPKAVMLSVEELESIEETAKILAIPGARAAIKRGIKEIKEGKFVPLSDLK